jgi:hypothetical protein
MILYHPRIKRLNHFNAFAQKVTRYRTNSVHRIRRSLCLT